MGSDRQIDLLLADGPEPHERALFVSSDQPAVASHVGREDRREPSVRSSGCQGYLPGGSKPVYALGCEGQEGEDIFRVRSSSGPFLVLPRRWLSGLKGRNPPQAAPVGPPSPNRNK